MSVRQTLYQVLRTFGPAFLVSVAYLDPGNWATAIEGGSKFGYRLIWVVVLSHLIAFLLQVLAARLGIVTNKHLAEVCREQYPPSLCLFLWFLSEISIVALDLTMVLGTAVGMNLLFGIALLPCIFLTSLDFLVVFFMNRFARIGNVDLFGPLTVVIVIMVSICFVVEVVLSAPPLDHVLSGFIPGPRDFSQASIVTAVSLLGANVMPHNFYLHSALVKRGHTNHETTKERCQSILLDVAFAMSLALLINLAVLVVSASTFHSAGILVNTLQDAHDLMEQLLSSRVAPIVFGLALFLTSQLSTFTGTLSGQIVLQGFLNKEDVNLWQIRLCTRVLAILPAAASQYFYGDEGVYKVLVIAQVVLAFQLPFTLVPLIKATSNLRLMGPFASGQVTQFFAWLSTFLIFVANFMAFTSFSFLPDHLGIHAFINGTGVLNGMSWSNASLNLALLFVMFGAVALLVWMLFTPVTISEKPLNHALDVCIQTHEDIVHLPDHPKLEEIVLRDSNNVTFCALVTHPERQLGRGARKTLALKLDAFWSSFFDLHGQPVQSEFPPMTNSLLAECLLAIHSLENASFVLSSTDDPPWMTTNKTVISLLHIAMQTNQLDTCCLTFPWRCPRCSAAVTNPSAVSIKPGGAMSKDRNMLFVFGLWNLRQILKLCIMEPRPDLWGKYAAVLNRLQWLLPLLPCTIDDMYISREDVVGQLNTLERRLGERRGQKGTAPAATAYPKGKGVLIPIIKRYRRKLRQEANAPVIAAGSSLIGILYFLLAFYRA